MKKLIFISVYILFSLGSYAQNENKDRRTNDEIRILRFMRHFLLKASIPDCKYLAKEFGSRSLPRG